MIEIFARFFVWIVGMFHINRKNPDNFDEYNNWTDLLWGWQAAVIGLVIAVIIVIIMYIAFG